MQIITLSGRLGNDAETREAGGNQVTSFNLAVDQGYGDRKVSNWFRVSVWGKKGSGAAPYLLKGGIVTVVGELEIGEYNGKPQYNVRASDFTLPPKASGGQRQEPSRQSNERPGGYGATNTGYGGGGHQGFRDDLDSDVPFMAWDDPLPRRLG